MALNRWQGIGFLGADPEFRLTPTGAQCATFRVACTDTWKDSNGQKKEKTEWVTCVAWRHSAEHARRFLRKGSKVYVEGKFTTRSWEDKNGGGKRYTSEILVDNFQVLDKLESQAPAPQTQKTTDDYGYQEPQDLPPDDLPF